MARIDLMKAGMGAGVGVVDNYLEKQDTDALRTEPFKTWTDFFRLGVCLGGYAMQVFDFNPRLGDTLAQAGTPLLAKSAAKPLMQKLGLGEFAGVRSGYRINRVVRTALPSGGGIAAVPAAVEQRIPSRRQGI